ncbi:MAG: protein-tyrosine-phosphatase/DNA-binding transcriptional ArsR family regulator [Paracoccaceae bacterium]|jgi:protein-tyrosine-phosphatase/DNA-binding transcriptional ArsR family regulator
MESLIDASAAFAALGSPARLEAFRLLARHAPHPVRAGDIAAALGRPANTMSVQLAALSRAGLIIGARAGKTVCYRADPSRISSLLGFLGDDCCNGRTEICAPRRVTTALHVLFVCSGNAARSVVAEGMLNARAHGRMRASSAGSRPRNAIAPEAAAILRNMGVAARAPRDWRMVHEAPDMVFTLCDHTADEAPPIWPGRPLHAHWALPDPLAPTDLAARAAAFADLTDTLSARIDALLALPLARMEVGALQSALDAIALGDV